jgi:hypothetical protein
MRTLFLTVLMCFAALFALICSVQCAQNVVAENWGPAIMLGGISFVLCRLIWRTATGTDPAAKPSPQQPAPTQPS